MLYGLLNGAKGIRSERWAAGCVTPESRKHEFSGELLLWKFLWASHHIREALIIVRWLATIVQVQQAAVLGLTRRCLRDVDITRSRFRWLGQGTHETSSSVKLVLVRNEGIRRKCGTNNRHENRHNLISTLQSALYFKPHNRTPYFDEIITPADM